MREREKEREREKRGSQLFEREYLLASNQLKFTPKNKNKIKKVEKIKEYESKHSLDNWLKFLLPFFFPSTCFLSHALSLYLAGFFFSFFSLLSLFFLAFLFSLTSFL